MALPTVDELPEPPQRLVDEKDAFVTKGDEWNLALYLWSYQIQALVAAMVAAYTADNYNATSTTSLAIGTGSKVFAIQTQKIFQVGQFAIAASNADPANYMYGQVTAHNATTGSLTINVSYTGGSGTKTDWRIALSGPRKQDDRTRRVLAAAESSTSPTAALITDTNGDWTFPVANGQTYRVQIIGTYQTAATATGGRLAIAAVSGATGTINGYMAGGINHNAAATALAMAIGALPAELVTTGVTTINTPTHIIADFVFVCTGSGSLEIRWGTEVGSSAAQLNAGSLLLVDPL
ncbi:hypothetical protein [Sphingomonas colocasiae]|uniref:Minor tail protein n=1 Tax=Sphingomonas colocasiae TaxID=1848973 RepID=A0ABS7PY43_9SPHN|nr:hypothetical protein [Sphingomonas colocasiae]MBY8826128.1 hypothetical protein [Sphingomonas colocasiae]